MDKLDPLEIESAVGDSLASRGFKVSKIPECSNRKTPDFEVIDSNGCRYLIEVKVRFDDSNLEAERLKVLNSGEVFGESVPVIFRNRLDGIVRSGAKQIDSEITENCDAFKVIWVVAVGRNTQAQIDQFRATLYGSTRIWSLNSNEGHRQCFYFRNSTFFAQRNTLDAVVVGGLKNASLYLNTLSTQYSSVKNSQFTAMFMNAVIDPIELEDSNCAYIVDGDVDRSDKNTILKFLENKYNASKLQNIDLSHMSGTILVNE